MSNQNDIIGIVKELQQLEKDLPSHGNGYGLDSSGVYDKGLTEEIIGMDNGVFYMEKKEVEFIIQSRNHFPTVAQALLIAVEALEVTRDTLQRRPAFTEIDFQDYALDARKRQSNIDDGVCEALSRIRSLKSE